MGRLEDLRLKYGPEYFVIGKELVDTGWRWPEVSVDECRGPSLLLETISRVGCFQGTPGGIGGARSIPWLCCLTSLASTCPCPAVVLWTQVLAG